MTAPAFVYTSEPWAAHPFGRPIFAPWDPAVLDLDVDELAPLRHQRILEEDADGAAAAESQRNYAAWKMEREALLAKASSSLINLTAG